ncbi:hypothetical protein LAZ67_19001720 [Cordylochernes scorpioides]|uniref:Integrase catalytic domain-containing protein n=1 Tax=Cordylochernes scorpioides TaxID=51811 RepID=A0ABY6LM43_9ARAC|nr:hypothetical protein LAZ67_19001720 [Cordylochernes scorpioides]
MENNKVRQHSSTVSPEEYRSAVTTLVQWVQTESFPREIAELGTVEDTYNSPFRSPCHGVTDSGRARAMCPPRFRNIAEQPPWEILDHRWKEDGSTNNTEGFTSDSGDGPTPTLQTCRLPAPITFTGLDAFGPFTVTVGRRHEKRWVIIFTCLVTRAIHLEVGHALSTDEFMMGLSRFIDTRGRPDTIYSDNGTKFVRESKELKLAASEI